jgi:phosphate transport system substrate-binding protein
LSTLGTRIGGWAAAALAVGVGALALAPVAGARPAVPSRSSNNITLIGSGSSAAQPYMQALFKGYSQSHRNITFRYNPDGGNAGVQDVQAGRSEFAVQSRPPLPSDSGTTWDKLFLDGLCIVDNSSNNLGDISLSQLKSIFLGQTTNWNQVAGSNLSTTIDPVGRNPAAGTYTFFQQAVLNNQTQSSNVLQEGSDGLVSIKVGQDHNAIGYVGMAHAKGSGVRKMTIGGVACNDANVKNESYPLWRFIWGLWPTKHPNTNVQKFFDWARTSHQAGQIIKNAGAVPVYNQGF